MWGEGGDGYRKKGEAQWGDEKRKRGWGERERVEMEIQTKKKRKKRGEEKTRRVLFLLASSPLLVIPEGLVGCGQ